MELSGRTYVVAGGAGVAGECLTEALLRRGATVAVPSRSSVRLDRLRAGLDPELRHRLHGLLGDLGEPAAADRLGHRLVDAVGRPDGVIASLGAWWEGEPLTQVPYQT